MSLDASYFTLEVIFATEIRGNSNFVRDEPLFANALVPRSELCSLPRRNAGVVIGLASKASGLVPPRFESSLRRFLLVGRTSSTDCVFHFV